MAAVLPTDYYLHNFKQLLDFVIATYSDVLSPQENDYYDIFCSLSEDSQRLYIRLLCRSKSLFRLSKLSYPEISNLDSAAAQLAENGLAQINPSLPLAELLPLFTISDIVSRLSSKSLKGLTRAELEQAVLEIDDATVVDQLRNGETIIEVLGEEHFASYKLCFFGNLQQDMTDFVLRDLGLHRYENYIIDTETRLFSTREQLLLHLQYYRCSNAAEDAMAAGVDAILNLHDELPVPLTGDTVLTRRCHRLTNRLARELERFDAPAQALTLYQQSARSPARERTARLHLKLGDVDKALDLCKTILAQPQNEDEAIFADGFGYRAAKKHGKPWSKPVPFKTCGTTPGIDPDRSVRRDDYCPPFCC